MKQLIEAEAAGAEVDRLVEFFGVAPEGDAWLDSRKKLVKAAGEGRLTLDEERELVRLVLVKPIEKENGEKLAALDFHEPTAADFKLLDRYRAEESMAKTIHLVSRMTGVAIGLLDRLGARDLGTVGAVASLFF